MWKLFNKVAKRQKLLISKLLPWMSIVFVKQGDTGCSDNMLRHFHVQNDVTIHLRRSTE